MAAYHWEARRKQILVDRRLPLQEREAYTRKQRKEVAREAPKEQPNSPVCPNTEAQNPAPQAKKGLSLESCHRREERATESCCPCNTEHVPNHSGKLLKRYSNLEYTQQW